ncbi:MAG: response regulator [Cyanobacteria bacterium]|nr:response regulator [Cyanobacteriota bacterium]MDA0866251.1 response regulator [Cyanobacteriota bacterium]
MKVLIVEDDQDVGQTLKLLLKRYAYVADWVEDGEAGLEMISAFDYDLLLLDVMLPGINGVDLCKQLRSQGWQAPILLLTGRDGGTAKAIALNSGADDYVVKPFHVEELIARIQALLRRCNTFIPSRLTWGKLSVNSSCHFAAYGPHELPLTPKEYAILELLLRHPQRPLNAVALLDYAWDSAAMPGEETIRGHIKTLRKKLAQASAPPDLIKTIHRVGYQLNPLYGSPGLSPAVPKGIEQQVTELTTANRELQVALNTVLTSRSQNQALAQCQGNLEASQQGYQALFDGAVEGIVTSDRQGMIQSANSAAALLLGREVEQLRGQSLQGLIPQGDRPQFQQHVEAALQGHHPWTVPLSAPIGTLWLELLPANAPTDEAGRPITLQWLLRPQPSG